MGLTAMFPVIRRQQRLEKYQSYLREQPEEALMLALESNLDEHSLCAVRKVLAEYRQH